jgi:glycosyltransferase involved in cell wall biosynthesis
MRILKIWDGEYPWDVRAEKVCRALTEAGHAVHMVARNRDRRHLREKLEECTVHRMPPWGAPGSALDSASQFPAFFNPRWIRLMMRVGRATQAELVLVRDLPLAPAAIHVARRLRVPVVLDMAENYPAMIRDLWTTGSTRFGDFLVRNPRAVEAVERWSMRRLDHVVVVVEESGDRLVRTLEVPRERITVVGNTPSLSRLERFPEPDPPPHGSGADRGPLSMVYLGLLEEARGVGTAIRAVALCRDRGVPVHFTVVGDGRAREDFRALGASLGLEDPALRMPGYIPYDQALEVVARSRIGIIPHFANESWNTTIPNKLFDYMAAGLAVITSDAVPARRVVTETGAGLSFRSGDAEDLAASLSEIWESGTAARMGALGRKAIRERWNWEADRARLLAALEATAGSPRRRGG